MRYKAGAYHHDVAQSHVCPSRMPGMFPANQNLATSVFELRRRAREHAEAMERAREYDTTVEDRLQGANSADEK